MDTVNRKSNPCTTWSFVDDLGSFRWHDPHPLNELYFPICNEAGMMASVTPRMHGDATTGQHTFLRRPLVMEDLHNTRSTRNLWIFSQRFGAYSLTGCSAAQQARAFCSDRKTEVTVSGSFLSHSITRNDRRVGICSEMTCFCPVSDDKVEIILVGITNTSSETLSFVPTTCFPIYGRSADNLRDHNHWTSLCHRIAISEFGLVVTPEIHHDEAGHRPNRANYFVLACGGDGEKPIGQFPTVREFIGEGDFDWPQAVVENRAPPPILPNSRDGMEAVGAIRFSERTLGPGETCEYIIIEGVTEDPQTVARCIERYGSSTKAQEALGQNHAYWKQRVERIAFETADKHFDRWMHWVALQPILRKIYGNSFLPHFDYGRGGRGWRDLWQDMLALLLQDPDEVKDSLVAYFAGVRLDGSNATIINKELGEFAADRNKISRVWMDHGVWPLFTLKLYIDQTGDIEVISSETTYWRDHQIFRAKSRDTSWDSTDGYFQKTADVKIYQGSILEHILVQHLTCFCNSGEHNNMKLADADWNDLLDLANERGESVPFSAFYGRNLIDLADLLLEYARRRGVDTVQLFTELVDLAGLNGPFDFGSPEVKQARLGEYFSRVHSAFRGIRVPVPISALAQQLRHMGEWTLAHIRKQEWIESNTGHGFFNGYYNNDGDRVDGDNEDGPRMNLTAQTFAIMSGAATSEQVARIHRSCQAILRDLHTGGYRLTTHLGPNKWNFGRGFAVVYGEKETGGAFNHMIVMYLNSLYRRGFVKEGYEVFSSIYSMASETQRAKIYPGLPEYFDKNGQGKYHYLSGSASWLLMTMLTVIFGIRGEYGDLVLHPKLVKDQFDLNGRAVASAFFRGERIVVTYENRDALDYGEYAITNITLNGQSVPFSMNADHKAMVSRESLDHCLRDNAENQIVARLEKQDLPQTPWKEK